MHLGRLALPEWSQTIQEERPLIGPGFIWGFGIALPAVLLTYALGCIISQQALIFCGPDLLLVSGTKAWLAGVAFASLAGLLHLQCFWDARYDSTRPAARAKLVCFLVLGVSVYTLCFQMLMSPR